jgi:hypothetical protein
MPPRQRLQPHQIEAELEKEARLDAERYAAAKAAKSPCTVLEGIRRKYKYKKPEEVDVEANLEDERILAHTGAKQALHLLTRVFMPDENVVSVGEEGELATACGAIEELDLAGNGLQAWGSIVTIVDQLPNLHWLGLNRLRLDPLGAALPTGLASALGGLRTLCLGETGLPWEKMLLLAAATPLLEELHFNGNAVAVLRPAEGGAALEDVLPRLHTLYLEDNLLDSWDALTPLATLPALHTLNVNGNAIPAVPPLPGFASLRVIMLRGNPISDWSSIDHLDALPQLCEARRTPPHPPFTVPHPPCRAAPHPPLPYRTHTLAVPPPLAELPLDCPSSPLTLTLTPNPQP